MQDAYARLVTVADVGAIRNVRAYFFRTAHSAAIDRLRRLSVVSIEAVADVERLSPVEVLTPEDEAVGRNELQLLARLIQQLPEKTRRVFMLSRISGLSQKEIARETGFPESTVEKHIAKAFVLLMAAYADGGYDAPDASRFHNARNARRMNGGEGNG